VGQPDGLITQINRATFPVPARSAEGAEERLDRQNPVVERVAIIRNAKNEGIDMIDHVCGQARSICQQNGQVAVGRVAVQASQGPRYGLSGTAQIVRSSRDTARRPTCTNNQSCPVV
jgi:hypothetical protein